MRFQLCKMWNETETYSHLPKINAWNYSRVNFWHCLLPALDGVSGCWTRLSPLTYDETVVMIMIIRNTRTRNGVCKVQMDCKSLKLSCSLIHHSQVKRIEMAVFRTWKYSLPSFCSFSIHPIIISLVEWWFLLSSTALQRTYMYMFTIFIYKNDGWAKFFKSRGTRVSSSEMRQIMPRWMSEEEED